MFDFLFLKHDVPSKGYHAGDMKPAWAATILILCVLAGGYLDAHPPV